MKKHAELSTLINESMRDENGQWLPDAERYLVEAAMVEDVPSGAALFKIADGVQDRMRITDEERPMRDDQDLSKDLVYRLGMRAGISLVRAIPVAARAVIAEQRKG